VGVLTTAGLGLVLITASWAAFPGANRRIGYSIYEQRGDEVELFMMATVRPDGSRRTSALTLPTGGRARASVGAFSR
jgi:hypothetical protein